MPCYWTNQQQKHIQFETQGTKATAASHLDTVQLSLNFSLSLSPWGKKRDSMTIIRSSYIIVTSFFSSSPNQRPLPLTHFVSLPSSVRLTDRKAGISWTAHSRYRQLQRVERVKDVRGRESWSMQQQIQHRWQEHVWASDKAILGRNCQCISKGMPTAKIREDLHCALDCLGCKIALVLYFFGDLSASRPLFPLSKTDQD